MYTNNLLQCLATMYGWVISSGANLQSLFLLWMRLSWGHQFMLTGLDKIYHLTETTQYFTTLQIAYPEFHAYLTGYGEFFFGGLLFIGLAARLAAIPLILFMISAFCMAHAHVFEHYGFITNPVSLVSEAPYPFLITALIIFIFGPGRISIDYLIQRWVNKQPTY